MLHGIVFVCFVMERGLFGMIICFCNVFIAEYVVHIRKARTCLYYYSRFNYLGTLQVYAILFKNLIFKK